MNPSTWATFPVPATDWPLILPIAMVALTGIFALIYELIYPKSNNTPIVGLSLVGLVITGLLLIMQGGLPPASSFANTIVRDSVSLPGQLIMVLGTALIILFSEPYLREKRIPFGEFYPLILWSLAGGMLMISTKNLLVMFVGLEILSISLYVLAGICRVEVRSEESAMKYFLLGAFASAFLLYGFAFLYGATGSLEIGAIGEAWSRGQEGVQPLLAFGLALILIGVGFKSSLVPFHQWTPDVYQGAPTNVTAYMATVAKTAAFFLLYRLVDAAIPMREIWLPILSTIAVLSMVIGNVAALRQTDVKRVLAYSSVANAGYVLVAIIAHGVNPGAVGSTTLAITMFSYTLMTVGAFAILSLGAKDGKEVTEITDLNGLWHRSPFVAVGLVVFMASSIGLPLTTGFLGKSFIFLDALKANQVWLAVMLALASIVSAYYYLRIAYAAIVPDDQGALERLNPVRPVVTGAVAICLLGVVGGFLFFTPIYNFFAFR